MPYLGTLQESQPYSLEVQSTVKVALAFINIRRYRISEVESSVFDPSSVPTQSRSIPSNVSRVLIEAAAPVGQTAVVKISQGISKYEITLAPDASIQFDVV